MIKIEGKAEATKAALVTTAVAAMGGLKDAGTLEEAENWYREQLGNSKAPSPVEIYIKGTIFKGLIFARYASPEVASVAIDMHKTAGWKYKGVHVWCNPDRPIESGFSSHF